MRLVAAPLGLLLALVVGVLAVPQAQAEAREREKLSGVEHGKGMDRVLHGGGRVRLRRRGPGSSIGEVGAMVAAISAIRGR